MAVRAELAAAAMQLFAERGYEEVTVEQIAAAAGVSRSSFFRYFTGKDDVLLQSSEANGQQLAQQLSARPREESSWMALRRSFDPLLVTVDADLVLSGALLTMLLTTPDLHGAHLAKQADWRDGLARELSTRPAHTDHTGVEPARLDPMAALALAGSALACLEAAQTVWVAQPDLQRAGVMGDLLDAAMNAVHPLDVDPA
jgi:AcrR family transcriptional regulator